MRNNAHLFFILYALTFCGGVFSKELLGTEELYYGSLAEQLTTEQLQQIRYLNDVWGWVGYAILPLSLESLFGYVHFERWYIYPMQIVNLFEVVYWTVLTVLLAKTLLISHSRALMLVTISYGAGLVLWVVGIMFLILTVS